MPSRQTSSSGVYMGNCWDNLILISIKPRTALQTQTEFCNFIVQETELS